MCDKISTLMSTLQDKIERERVEINSMLEQVGATDADSLYSCDVDADYICEVQCAMSYLHALEHVLWLCEQ